MSKFDKIANLYASGANWDTLLRDAGTSQLQQLIREARQAAPEMASPFLGYLCSSPIKQIRRDVAEASTTLPYSEALTILLPLLNDEDDNVRVQVVSSLASLRSRGIVPLLERMSRDASWRVRRAVAETLPSLIEVSPEDTLTLCAQLILDSDAGAAMGAFDALADFSGTTRLGRRAFELLNDTYDYLDELERVVVEASRPKRPARRKGPGARGGRYPIRVDPSSPVDVPKDLAPSGEVQTAIEKAQAAARTTRAAAQRPRHLYTWWSGMWAGDEFQPGQPANLILSSYEGYAYQLAGIFSPDRLPAADKHGQLPESIDREGATLAVALLADERHLTVDPNDSPVKPLQLPPTGMSGVASFKIRTLRQGLGSLEILIYHRGCLIMRAKIVATIQAVPGRVQQIEGAPSVGAALNPGYDAAAIAADIQRDRFGSLLIDRDETTRETVFALYHHDDDGDHFVSARVPEDSARPDYARLQDRLSQLVDRRKGFFRRPVLQPHDFSLALEPETADKVLDELREIGRSLWTDLFSHDTALAVRKHLDKLVSAERDGGLLQIVSDRILVPWQLLYIDDRRKKPHADRLWGMRFEIEHSLGACGRLKTPSRQRTREPMIAYINENLPPNTCQEHYTFLSPEKQAAGRVDFKHRESDVIADFSRADNRRPAVYFFCHAGFAAGSIDKTWIELTDKASRLTLRALRDQTLLDAQQANLEFQGAPLIFVNACESGQVASNCYDSFIGFLLKQKKAGGVIGCATLMPAYFATSFARDFWTALQSSGEPQPVSRLLYTLRRDLWTRHRNPLGLFYSLYTNAELTLAGRRAR